MSRENGLYYPGLIKLAEPCALRALHRAGRKRCLISIAEYGAARPVWNELALSGYNQ